MGERRAAAAARLPGVGWVGGWVGGRQRGSFVVNNRKEFWNCVYASGTGGGLLFLLSLLLRRRLGEGRLVYCLGGKERGGELFLLGRLGSMLGSEATPKQQVAECPNEAWTCSYGLLKTMKTLWVGVATGFGTSCTPFGGLKVRPHPILPPRSLVGCTPPSDLPPPFFFQERGPSQITF